MAEAERDLAAQAAFAATVAQELGADSTEVSRTLAPRRREIEAALTLAAGDASQPLVAPALPRLLLRGEEGRGQIPDLEVTGLIGQGAMGRVDSAVQLAFGRVVAVKRVRPDRRCAPALQALQREAAITGALDHPNIVPAFAFGLDAHGDPLLVMKRVRGAPWSRLLGDPQHPGWGGRSADWLGRNLEVFCQVCNAVESAHRLGIVHRDLKPENVVVGDLGEVYLIDWGVAVRLDDAPSPQVAGTPAYMAPEMLYGSTQLSVRSDVYLLGAVLHEVLTGRPRHRGETLGAVFAAVSQSAPVEYPDSVPEELAALCNRATARDPAQRFDSALAVRIAVDEFLLHRSAQQLCQAGQRAVERQRQAIAQGDDAEVRRAAAEADFAFRQALATWPGNAPARLGRRQGLELMLDYELAQRNAPGARAVIDALEDPPPRLADQVARLEAERAEERRAQLALAQLRHDSDDRVSAFDRIKVMAGTSLLISASALLAALGGVVLTHPILLGIFLVSLTALLGLYRVARHRLMATEANRRIQYGMLIALAMLNSLDLLVWSAGYGPELTLGFYAVIFIMLVVQQMLRDWSYAFYLPGLVGMLVGLLHWPGRPLLWLGVAWALVGLGTLPRALVVGRTARQSAPAAQQPAG